LLSEKYIYLR